MLKVSIRRQGDFHRQQSCTSDSVQGTTGTLSSPAVVATEHCLLELDSELDALGADSGRDRRTGRGERRSNGAPPIVLPGHGCKVDRIGRFLRIMETRADTARRSGKIRARARRAQNKIEQTESIVLYYLASHDLKKVESTRIYAEAESGLPRTVW